MSQHYSILPTLLNWYVERVTLSWVQCSSLHRSWNWYVVVVLVHGWKTAVVSVGPSMPSFRRRDRLPEPSLESELASSSPSIGSCLRLHQSACVSSLLAPDRDLFGTVSLLPSNPEGFPFETDRVPFRKGTWAGFDPGSIARCKRHPRAIGGRTEAIRLRGKQLARAWLPSDRTRRRKEVEEAVRKA